MRISVLVEFLEGESHRPNSIALRANRFSSFIRRENNNVSFDLLFRFDDTTVFRTITTYSPPTICKYSHFFKLLFRFFLSYRWFYFSSRVASRGERRREIQLKSVLPVTIISHVRDSGSITDRRLLPCKHRFPIFSSNFRTVSFDRFRFFFARKFFFHHFHFHSPMPCTISVLSNICIFGGGRKYRLLFDVFFPRGLPGNRYSN